MRSPGNSVKFCLLWKKSAVDRRGRDQDVVVIVNVLDRVAGSPEASKVPNDEQRVRPLTRSIGSRWYGHIVVLD